MHNMLKNILEKKRKDLNIKKNNSFKNAILDAKGVALIGELKFASPIDGRVGSASEIVSRAEQYEKAKLDAISIITEKHFFKGDTSFVPVVKKLVNLPILQKDFIIDTTQIFEAKVLGSDALLLIARIVDSKTLQRFVALTKELRMEPVVEITSRNDLAKALKTETDIIAVNARDLDTFTIDLKEACNLMAKIPAKYIRLGFSGIKSSREVEQYKSAGAKGVLMGTSLMKARDIVGFVQGVKV